MLNRLSKEFLAAVCIALAIAVISLWPSPPYYSSQAPQIETEQQSNRGNESQENRDNSKAPITSRRNHEADNRADEISEYWGWTVFGHRVKITDSLLVLFTFTLWLATRDLATGAEDTAQRQLRAYIVAGPTGVRYEDLLKDKLVVEVTIRNTGQTPARELTVVSRTCVLAYPLKIPFDFGLISGPDPSHSILGKDQTLLHESNADAILTGDEMLRVTNPEGGFRVYTYGTVNYRDVFDVPQHTNFCCTHLFREDESLGHSSEYHNDAS